MYYPYFITYMVSGLVVSLIVFFWALKNGQFRDQQRARFLPLADESEAPPDKVSRIGRIETYALFGLACGGLLSTVMVLTFALIRAR